MKGTPLIDRTSKSFYRLFNNLNYLYLVSIIFIIHVIIKLFLVKDFYGPFILNDEYLYVDNAFRFFDHFSFGDPLYPPLYSIIISISYLWGDSFYQAILIINVLLSSSLIFPVYLLSKQFLNKHYSLLLSLISIIIPFQFNFPKMVMAENVLFPLYILTLYFVMEMFFKKKNIYTFLSAFFSACCFLSKYLAFTLILSIIALFLYEFFKNFNERDRRKYLIKQIFIYCLSLLVFILPFIIINYEHLVLRSQGYLGTTEINPVVVNTALNCFYWSIIYVCYLVLMISPFLIFLFIKTKYDNPLLKSKINTFILFTFFNILFLLALAIRHSSNSDFSSRHMLGRYIMYLFMPLAIISMTKLSFYYRLYNKKNIIEYALAFFLLFLVLLSYMILIEKKFITTADWIIMSHTTAENYSYYVLRYYQLIPIFFILLFFILKFKFYRYFKVLIIFFIFFYYIIQFKILVPSLDNFLFFKNHSFTNILKETHSFKYNYIYTDNSQIYFLLRFYKTIHKKKFRYSTNENGLLSPQTIDKVDRPCLIITDNENKLKELHKKKKIYRIEDYYFVFVE